MKFIPEGISRKIAQQGLLASENAPKVLFVGGVVGMVGSTVLACRATLKLEEVLDEVEHEKAKQRKAEDKVDSGEVREGVTYTDDERRRDIYLIHVKGAAKVARLYAPAVVLGGASIFALTKSHNMLRDRNIALAAAYAAVDGAFSRYRGRVVDRYGEDVDRDLRYEYSEPEDIVDEETGEVTTTSYVVDAPGSAYKRFYDELSSRNWGPDHSVNMFFLKQVQNNMNDKLQKRGHVFLNEVFDALGMSHTRAGQIVGWRYKKDSGDDCIDFGCWDGVEEKIAEYNNGQEGAILLDFNVDGPMYNLIEEGDA